MCYENEPNIRGGGGGGVQSKDWTYRIGEIKKVSYKKYTFSSEKSNFFFQKKNFFLKIV